jgi:hypothetical protein
VRSQTIWRASLSAAVVAAALAVGGCSASSNQTPQIIYVTDKPSQQVATATPSPTEQATPTLAPTETAAATETAAPTATPAPTPTPAGSAAPGQACTGNADNKAFFAVAATKMNWTVYCGVVPAGWYLSSASFDHAPNGKLIATYNRKSGGVVVATVLVREGNFCTSGASACSAHDTDLGPAMFGDLNGELYTLGPGLGYAIYVSPGTTRAYEITGNGMTQATFVAIAAALTKVPKA